MRGITLIEVAVAIAVLSMGAVAALRSTDAASRATAAEMPRLMARIAARNRAEALALGGVPGPDTVTVGGHRITLDTRVSGQASGLVAVTVTARTEAGPAAGLVVHLPVADLP